MRFTLLLLAAPLLAQKPITLTAVSATSGWPTVFVCLPSGVCNNAALDPGSLAVNTSTATWTLGAASLSVASAPAQVAVLPAWHSTEIFAGDGKTVAFTLGAVPIADSEFVAVNGALQVKSQDYTITGQVVTFTTAPAAKAVVAIRYQVQQAQNLF